MTSEEGYCPYCNRQNCSAMSDEHVIPTSIGGDDRTLIKVCKNCNDLAGRTLDTSMSRDGWLGVNALLCGISPHRHRRLPSKTKLKDGQQLDGVIHFRVVETGILPSFTPNKTQPDGSTWLSEDVVVDRDRLPDHINVFQRESVEYWGLDFPPGEKRDIAPGLLKVLLGLIYIDQGRDVVSSPAFDVLRSCLSERIDSRLQWEWIDGKVPWGDGTVQNNQHAFWFECPNSGEFRGGVVLFGSGMRFFVENFGIQLPKRCALLEARSGRTGDSPTILW